MPCILRKPSYQSVSCSSEEPTIQSRTELCLETEHEHLINPRIQRRQKGGGIKEYLLRIIRTKFFEESTVMV